MIFLSRSGYCSDVSLRAVFIGRVFIALLCVQEDPNDRPHMSSVAKDAFWPLVLYDSCFENYLEPLGL